MLDKQNLRHSIRNKRRQLSFDAVRLASLNVLRAVTVTDEFVSAKKIALYCSDENEIATEDIIQWCCDQGKSVCLPVMKSKSVLQFYEYGEHQWVLSSYGIKEPNIETCQMVSLADCDVIVVPLVAFDRSGGRIGRGGGYYDRALEAVVDLERRPLLVGLAYDFQEVFTCESQEHDVALDIVVLNTSEVLYF